MLEQIPKHVTIVAVSKTQPIEQIRQKHALGFSHFGENYLNEAEIKIKSLLDLNVQWHYIGHIQTKKCKKLARYFDWVQTVESEAIAQELNRCNQNLNKIQNILIQVKVLPDEHKGGCSFLECRELIAKILPLKHLKLRGLMTILPLGLSKKEQYQAFENLKVFFNESCQTYQIDMDTLSMGMSDDYDQAILTGSNMIRLGRAIFGERH